jgi:hypothetical protein
MAKTHVAQPGDHIPKIAARNGFQEVSAIWDHPQNASLKATRQPCELAPGDHVFLPDQKDLEFKLSTGKKHTIVVKRPKIRLRVAFKDASGRPVTRTPRTLECGKASFPFTLDGDGKLDQEIPIETEDARAIFEDGDVAFQVGHLQPIDLRAGQLDRLNNLGYDVGIGVEEAEERTGPSAGGTDPGADGAAVGGDGEDQGADEEAKEAERLFQSALEEFQCDNGLEVTGKLDGATRAKLLEVHGS